MKGRGERLWLIVSHVWFRSCSDFGWFYCTFLWRSREGQSRSHRENWHRRWGNDGKELEMKHTQEQNSHWRKVGVWARDKGLCISALSSVSDGCSAVWICKCMSHTRGSGRVHTQDWVLAKDEVISSTSTSTWADVLTMASPMCFLLWP